ncbi:MAG: glycogen/starch/alpha-glucan phosphorylase [Synechococcus sp.]
MDLFCRRSIARLKSGGYNPWDFYKSNSELRQVIGLISSGMFSHENRDLFQPIVDSLLFRDPFLLLPDYQSYIDCQERIDTAYRDLENWTQMSILNVARMSKFSSDRSIREYAEKIWHVRPVPIQLQNYSKQNAGLIARPQEGGR